MLRHRRRYLGVVLAIALGTAGFITINTMGRDFKKNCNQDLDLIGGATVIRVSLERQPDSPPPWFRPQTVEALRQLPGVAGLSQMGQRWSEGYRHRQKVSFLVYAVDEYFWTNRSFWPLHGKLFGPQAMQQRRREVVLGATLAQKIFGHQKVVGNFLEIEKEEYQVTGVLGGVTDDTMANSAYLPLTTAQDRYPVPIFSDRLFIRCLTWDDVDRVAAAVPGVVQQHQSNSPLRVEVSWEVLKRVKKVAWWIEFFIYMAVGATLILGGVGIWIVMMAAVRSRTREIGLKKAMGAEDRDILAQFLTEALCLSLGAALLGVGLGRLAVEVLGYIIDSRPPEALFFLCLGLGLLFAVGLGVGAGLYPSVQASRMEVVSATRYE